MLLISSDSILNYFTRSETTDMYFINGLANENEEEAVIMYKDKYPNRVILCAKTFRMLQARLSDTGIFNKNGLDVQDLKIV